MGIRDRACILETLLLSIYNHDCAVASAASRMATAAGGRPLIEMGSRRTHEAAAVAAARAAYVCGFATTSNLEAARRYGIPSAGTSAHSFTLLHDTEEPVSYTHLDVYKRQHHNRVWPVTSTTTGKSTALLTDHYELTMLQAALHSGAAHRRGVFELFGRRLPDGRRYGVVAGVGRALDCLLYTSRCV